MKDLQLWRLENTALLILNVLILLSVTIVSAISACMITDILAAGEHARMEVVFLPVAEGVVQLVLPVAALVVIMVLVFVVMDHGT